ncbi:hypothetical protein PLUTE_b0084 [Pseudoalteromonas luteoviolacea DSM 6061]|nr:hypothetical protein [Pseudoalteromonas luteoviolacea DSM 6061]
MPIASLQYMLTAITNAYINRAKARIQIWRIFKSSMEPQ